MTTSELRKPKRPVRKRKPAVRGEERRVAVSMPAGSSSALPSAVFGGRPDAFHATGPDAMRRWFEMKYVDDVSDIRREQYGYYKHHVHHFIDGFFTAKKVCGKKVLDLGCGPGFYSAMLAERGARVTGVDQDGFLIEKANALKARRGLENLEFVRAEFDSRAARWSYGEFDYVLAIDVVVSFDYLRARHAHRDVVRAFRGVRRLLSDRGRFYIVESHPFFGRVMREAVSDTGERFWARAAHYKFEHKPQGDPNHWFTLEEMTAASSESGLAIARIFEPNPAPALELENVEAFRFRSRCPGMIVYEICKMMGV